MIEEATKEGIIKYLNEEISYLEKRFDSFKGFKWNGLANTIETELLMMKAIRRLIENQPDKYKIFHDHIKAHFEKEHPDWRVVCKICGRDIDMIFQQKNAQIKEGEGKSTPQNIPVRIKEKEEG